MAQALTAPIAVAALVLCVAGGLKLRRPESAARAVRDLGLPGASGIVRAFAAGEVALGAWALAAPSRITAAALCVMYLMFAGIALRLAHRARSCGCFGTGDTPASAGQAVLSTAFALLAACAVGWPAHGAGWLLGRPPIVAVPFVVGLLGGVYATVLAYTELPAAWNAWSRA